jgi:ribonuclease HII
VAFPEVFSSEEKARLKELVFFEQQARSQGYKLIAGIDEAGRGPLAGPVVAAACIIPHGIYFSGINDSKKLLPKQREILFAALTTHPKVIYALGVVSPEIIDCVNIYQATIQAMIQAVAGLSREPDYLLVDGLVLPHSIPSQKIIGGDARSQSIAAASVLAKVTRDRMAQEWEIKWPQYGFGKHKGYGTPQHLIALAQHGPCALHRHSFSPIAKKKMVQLEFEL